LGARKKSVSVKSPQTNALENKTSKLLHHAVFARPNRTCVAVPHFCGRGIAGQVGDALRGGPVDTRMRRSSGWLCVDDAPVVG